MSVKFAGKMEQVNPNMNADVSLVLCTYGRVKEVDTFLKSIYSQTTQPGEVIIVDQNEKNILSDIIKKWQTELPIIHKRVNFKGASKSRNFGASEAKFSIVAFPDDDCLYPSELVKSINRLFQVNDDVDVILAAKIDPSQCKDDLDQRDLSYSQVISTLDLFKAKAETSNIFAKKSSIESLSHIFNESIGPGADTPWASNEETDLLIRLLKQGAKIIKLNKLPIAHHSLQGTIAKSFRYGMGRFQVISTNQLGTRIYLINLLQPIARYLKNPKPHNLLLCMSTILGRSGVFNVIHTILN